jgi:hypothetical protein
MNQESTRVDTACRMQVMQTFLTPSLGYSRSRSAYSRLGPRPPSRRPRPPRRPPRVLCCCQYRVNMAMLVSANLALLKNLVEASVHNGCLCMGGRVSA